LFTVIKRFIASGEAANLATLAPVATSPAGSGTATEHRQTGPPNDRPRPFPTETGQSTASLAAR